MPATAHISRYPRLAHPPGPGRPPKSTAAKVVSVVFSPVGVLLGASLVLAFAAVRATGRADAAEKLVRDLIDRGAR